jgi:fatty-acyl-CoA synthase
MGLTFSFSEFRIQYIKTKSSYKKAPAMPLPTLSDAVKNHARIRPHALAVKDSSRELSYAAWDQRATALANGLAHMGLNKGDRVAVLAANGVEWMEIYAGLARAALVVVPINFRLSAPEVAYILNDSGARCLLAQREFANHLIESGLLAEFTHLALVALFDSPPPMWKPYESLFHPPPAARDLPVVHPADTSALMYTSGTTGNPKGVIRSHQGSTLIAMATAVEMGFDASDRALIVMPLCHANSLYFSHTFAHLGATCIIDDSRSFDAHKLLALLSSAQITFTSLVPTHYIMMLGLPSDIKAQYNVDSVGKLMVSSAPVRKETKQAILQFFRVSALYELYGSTEAGWVTLLRPHEQLDHLGSIGREWAYSAPVRVINADGNEVPDGEVGEIYSNTAYSFDGYWRLEEKTQQARRGDWCSVGDMGYRDAQGYLYLVDRKSNMIISGGENIYPSEVEAVLSAHTSVRDVAVIGVPHEKWGETVHAFVVLHEGHQATAEDLTTWCAKRLARYKVPSHIGLIDAHDMPRNATGKILHRVLRERAQQAKVLA